ADLFAEITRLKVARSNWSMEAKAMILAPMNDQKSAIIVDHVAPLKPEKLVMPKYLTKLKSKRHGSLQEREESLLPSTGGASNAWAISAKKSADGHAIVMNDPHLLHAWPSNFYLATLSADDFFVAGASVPGLPGILIGSTKHLAWGITAALLNTQDSVLLAPDETDKNFYKVDGKRLPFENWPQQYCLNKKNNCLTEVHQVSIFGPVLTHKFDPWIDEGDMVAVQWTGFHVDQHSGMSAGFVELAKAKNVFEAVKVVKTMSLPGVNLVLADTEGNIAYAYAGLVPKRDPAQNPYLPLDGSLRASRWQGFFKQGLEPSTINPAAGFIVTANQNIYGLKTDAELYFGKLGAPPFRAMRIKDRIEDSLKEEGKLDFSELATIQLDDTSLEAQELAPLVGKKCLEHFTGADSKRKAFAREVANFNGRYTTDSLGALPYEYLSWQIVSLGLKSALGEHLPEWVTYTGQATYVVKDALLQELRGKPSPIFAPSVLGSDKLDDLIGQACEAAFNKVVNIAGSSPWKWRWGRHHYLQRKSPLAAAPLIGGWFKDKKREVAGITNAPMAETGVPVVYGANIRFRVKLTNPPMIEAVLDSGNGGTIGQDNAFDQAKLWHEGKTIPLETDWQKAVEKSVTKFTLDG
ncbi:MAG TPA: penicillin acylase family protein, partial [Myxococcota bacterium]|nr:penicillin acylase family protein [Myxococcota bacterium]